MFKKTKKLQLNKTNAVRQHLDWTIFFAFYIGYKNSKPADIFTYCSHIEHQSCIPTFSFAEYDGVPIVIVGNLRGSKTENLTYQQIPFGVMDDSSCEHMYKEIYDTRQCKAIFEKVIEKCYDSNTGLIQILNQSTHKSNSDGSFSKKRGILSYLSFRRKKSHRSITRTRSAKSIA